jgi:hypothetical protein
MHFFMKNNRWLIGALILMYLAVRSPGQPAVDSVPSDHSLAPPTSDILVLSNVTGIVRGLDATGLLLEKNLVYLPRIPLTDLSPAELRALMETKTGYESLTGFTSLQGRHEPGAALERQLHEAWRKGGSLADKMQLRLEILRDLRSYNNEVALLPGEIAAVRQYEVAEIPIHDRLTNRAATAVAASAQVEATELDRAGNPSARLAEQQAQENYRELAVRVERANDRDVIAQGQVAGASQQVTDHEAKCAELAARLASHGINVAGAPPFYPVPSLTLRAEVDAERKAN